MYTKDEIATRSKANVQDHGEVFTPFIIVGKMIDLIPDKVWADPEYCFLEPTCGNGQILVKIFERRINAGISIETTLNTLIGMDIRNQNIHESHTRLHERVASEMRVQGIEQGCKEWFRLAHKLVAIVANNIFQVKDSIDYIKSGALDAKPFFDKDPTGNNQVQSLINRRESLNRIKKEFTKAKPNPIIAPFFVKKDAIV